MTPVTGRPDRRQIEAQHELLVFSAWMPEKVQDILLILHHSDAGSSAQGQHIMSFAIIARPVCFEPEAQRSLVVADMDELSSYT